MSLEYHIPVLLQESIDLLVSNPQGTYVDVTFGAGGHSREILTRLSPSGRLISFDQDQDALANRIDDHRFELVHADFRYLGRFLEYLNVDQLDGLLADLGVSSHQFDEFGRGFSYRSESHLDMRMNRQRSLTAAEVVNTYSEMELVKVFSEYGQVRNAKTLASRILEERARRPISTIPDFIEILRKVSRGNPVRYLAQVFQAIRIEVNDEIDALRKLLQTSAKVLKPGGTLVVLTYHSVEDRLVKHFMKDRDQDEVGKGFQVLTKKPIYPSDQEMKHNQRASSAKLRAAQKL